jgi:hypothetical protein
LKRKGDDKNMQFKKLAAITGSALMAGLSLVGPALATSVTSIGDINDLVSATDSTVSFPLFVVGANALPADIAGGIGVAVRMAANAKTTEPVTVEVAGLSVTGGVGLHQPGDNVVLGEAIDAARPVLTASDLDILAPGTYETKDHKEFDFSQYITLGSGATVTFAKPSGEDIPVIGVQLTSGGGELYVYKMAFSKQVSTTTTNIATTVLDILGKGYTITGATVSSDNSLSLDMLAGEVGGAVTTDAPQTFTVGGEDYTVTLVMVGQDSLGDLVAVLSVNGESLTLNSGETDELSDGTTIGVIGIIQGKTGIADSAEVYVGANKVTLSDSAINTDTWETAGFEVAGDSVDDVFVKITGTSTATGGVVKISEIAIKYDPTLELFIEAGESFTDPAFGEFKVVFSGITPDVDSAQREDIDVFASSSNVLRTTLDVKQGQTLTQDFAYRAGADDFRLQDAAQKDIVVVEQASFQLNDYVVLSQGGFGHVLRLVSGPAASTAGTMKFTDMASGNTIEVSVDGSGDGTLYLDGYSYNVDWDGTDCDIDWSTAGTEVVYPVLETSKGALVALTEDVTLSVADGGTIVVPTGTIADDQCINFTDSSADSAVDCLVGGVYYIISDSAGDVVTIGLSDTPGTAGGSIINDAALLVVEESDENLVTNSIVVPITETTADKIEANTPLFTDSTTGLASFLSVGTLDKTEAWDTYGTQVVYDFSGAQSRATISYPDYQAFAGLALGPNPVISSGAAGEVTRDVVLPVTADIAKLDSEVTAADKADKDLVLMGGPCINSLVAELATAGLFPYGCADWPGSNFGRVDVIADAFETGQTALVIAGTRAADTDLAARIVQTGFPGATTAELAESTIEITGSVSSPSYA